MQSAVEKLCSIERVNRKTRKAPETLAIWINIIRLLHEQIDWKESAEYAILISKRRAQLKVAVQKTIQEIVRYLDKTPEGEKKLLF